MSHTLGFLGLCERICREIDATKIRALVNELVALRERGGRLFILGVGGSAANASHAVNDFRKLCGIEAYAPSDNVAEMTARINDDGWETVFSEWLMGSRLNERDAILVLSVGGGSMDGTVSACIIAAACLAKARAARVLGIVGRADGWTAVNGDVVVIVPPIAPALVTPLSEAFQSVVWHLLVSHPKLRAA